MATNNLQTLADSYNPIITKYAQDEFANARTQYDKLVHPLKTDREYEMSDYLTGVGYMQIVGDGQPYPRQNSVEGYTTFYQQQKRALEYAITDEANLFFRFGNEALKAGKFLGDAVRRTIEKDMFNMLNNGFDTSATSFGDGKPLFSTIHPLKDSQTSTTTYSNALPQSDPLSNDSLFTLYTSFMETLDDKGMLQGDASVGRQCTLYVPPTLKKTAYQILESIGEAYTADRQDNYYKMNADGSQWRIVDTPFIGAKAGGSDTAWFLGVYDMSSLMMKMARDAMITNYIEDNTKTLVYQADIIYDKGWDNWRYMGGSKGDESTYSS